MKDRRGGEGRRDGEERRGGKAGEGRHPRPNFENLPPRVKKNILERFDEDGDGKLNEEEKKKAIYLKADMAEKILLRLKERRKKEHQRDQESKEERALEDVIGSRFRIILPTELRYENS